jgi:hypothetical protein
MMSKIMKELKDYLHLYLGCDVHIAELNVTHKLTGISFDDTLRQLWCYFENTDTGYAPIEKCKPILRPLSDMNRDETIHYQEYLMSMPINNIIDAYRIQGEQVAYLLSKHFDLFQLIEAGLAIDATTLNK